VGDQVTPQTEVTDEQRAACQADVDRVIAHAGVSATGKVRIEPAWTDLETGERFHASWVAEVRVRRAADYAVIVMEVAGHVAYPSAWCELLDDEIRQAIGRAGMRRRA
jgi:predicted TIM-barrel enzyme